MVCILLHLKATVACSLITYLKNIGANPLLFKIVHNGKLQINKLKVDYFIYQRIKFAEVVVIFDFTAKTAEIISIDTWGNEAL